MKRFEPKALQSFLIIILMSTTSYPSWQTHCGSANHGLLVNWSTEDAITLKIAATQFLVADELYFTFQTTADNDYDYNFDAALYTVTGYYYNS